MQLFSDNLQLKDKIVRGNLFFHFWSEFFVNDGQLYCNKIEIIIIFGQIPIFSPEFQNPLLDL